MGMSDYEWNRETQREMHLTKAQIKALEAGEIVRTPLKGGTEFYLATEPTVIVCPHCGGTGKIAIVQAEQKDKRREA